MPIRREIARTPPPPGLPLEAGGRSITTTIPKHSKRQLTVTINSINSSVCPQIIITMLLLVTPRRTAHRRVTITITIEVANLSQTPSRSKRVRTHLILLTILNNSPTIHTTPNLTEAIRILCITNIIRATRHNRMESNSSRRPLTLPVNPGQPVRRRRIDRTPTRRIAGPEMKRRLAKMEQSKQPNSVKTFHILLG